MRPQAPQKARGAAYLGLPRGVAMASEMTPKPLEHRTSMKVRSATVSPFGAHSPSADRLCSPLRPSLWRNPSIGDLQKAAFSGGRPLRCLGVYRQSGTYFNKHERLLMFS